MEIEDLEFEVGDHVWFTRWVTKPPSRIVTITDVDEYDKDGLHYCVQYTKENGYTFSDWVCEETLYAATDEEIFLWKLSN